MYHVALMHVCDESAMCCCGRCALAYQRQWLRGLAARPLLAEPAPTW
jgi:hypothetical protein